MRVWEAGLRHLALVGNRVFLGYALGGGEGTAHLHRWLVHRARRGERTWAGCLLGPSDLGPGAGLVEGQKLSLSLLQGLQELYVWLGQGRDPPVRRLQWQLQSPSSAEPDRLTLTDFFKP